MPTPWDGMSPPKTESNNIVSQVKTAMDHPDGYFKRADELKQAIGSPTDKELKQAEAVYKEIQSEKKNIEKSLDEIDSLFDEKTRKSTELSEDVRNIKNTLNEIDKHLSQYAERLELLKEKGDNKTDDDIKWERKAHEQMSKLEYDKTGLISSLTKI